MFVKGDPRINRKGRPLKSRDKSHLLAETWSQRLEDELPYLTHKERAFIYCRLFCALVARQQAHLTPDQSVKNAQAAFELVHRMEKTLGINVTVGSSGGDQGRVDDRALGLQAPAASDNGL